MTEPAQRTLGPCDGPPQGIRLAALIAKDCPPDGRNPVSQGFGSVFCHRFGNWPMGIRMRQIGCR